MIYASFFSFPSQSLSFPELARFIFPVRVCAYTHPSAAARGYLMRISVGELVGPSKSQHARVWVCITLSTIYRDEKDGSRVSRSPSIKGLLLSPNRKIMGPCRARSRERRGACYLSAREGFSERLFQLYSTKWNKKRSALLFLFCFDARVFARVYESWWMNERVCTRQRINGALSLRIGHFDRRGLPAKRGRSDNRALGRWA